MIHLSQSWSRACLLILRLFTSNYQIVTLFLLQARLTKRPDTLDSFNDADVDDYSTQVCFSQVFSLSRYIFVVCHVFTHTCAQDDGGESTEPENQGNTLYFGQQVGKSLITDDDEQLLWIWRNVYILLWWSGGEGRGVHGERDGCGGVEEESKKVTCLLMKDMSLQQKICLHQM